MIRQIILRGFRNPHFPVLIQASGEHAFRSKLCLSCWAGLKDALLGPPTGLLGKASSARGGNRLCRPPETAPKMKGIEHYGKCRSLDRKSTRLNSSHLGIS